MCVVMSLTWLSLNLGSSLVSSRYIIGHRCLQDSNCVRFSGAYSGTGIAWTGLLSNTLSPTLNSLRRRSNSSSLMADVGHNSTDSVIRPSDKTFFRIRLQCSNPCCCGHWRCMNLCDRVYCVRSVLKCMSFADTISLTSVKWWSFWDLYPSYTQIVSQDP